MIRRILIAAVLALFAAPALAGSFTITVVVGSPALTFTFTQSVSDSALTGQFGPWLTANYPNTCSPEPCTPPATTVATAFQLWGAAMYAGTAANVVNAAKAAAAVTAAAGVAAFQ